MLSLPYVLVVLPAIFCLLRNGISRSALRRLAAIGGLLVIVLLGNWILSRMITLPDLQRVVVHEWQLAWLVCLSAYALHASRHAWKWIVRLLVLHAILDVGHEFQQLLDLIPSDLLRSSILALVPLLLTALIAIYFLRVFSVEILPSRVWFDSLYSSNPRRFRRLVAISGGWLLALFLFAVRRICLQRWVETDRLLDNLVLLTGALLVALMVFLAIAFWEQARGSRLGMSLRGALLLGGASFYGLLAISPDARCLPFVAAVALLPAWRRWQTTAIYAAVVGMLLIALIHTSLHSVASYGPRMFLYLAVVCFCYGFPREKNTATSRAAA